MYWQLWWSLYCHRLNSSITHVRKQLQSLWRPKVVNLLFEDLLVISNGENQTPKEKEDKGLTTEEPIPLFEFERTWQSFKENSLELISGAQINVWGIFKTPHTLARMHGTRKSNWNFHQNYAAQICLLGTLTQTKYSLAQAISMYTAPMLFEVILGWKFTPKLLDHALWAWSRSWTREHQWKHSNHSTSLPLK